jgi:Neprosin
MGIQHHSAFVLPKRVSKRIHQGATVAATALLLVLVGGKPALAQSAPTVRCEKRVAAEPPHVDLPAIQRPDGRPVRFEPQVRLKPVCPEGEVPVVEAPMGGRYIHKGNPLLGPYAAPGPEHALSPDFVKRNLLLQFDQVYWKRQGTTSPALLQPVPDGGDPPCNGIAWFGSCYFYSTAAENVVAGGGGFTLEIEAPVVVEPSADDSADHSIGEMAVMSTGEAGGTLNDVEIGFMVLDGDNLPRLFVYHWNDGAETCYNSCNWHQYSSTYSPGMDLTPFVGKSVYVGWVQYENAWWAWFNDQWMGYIENSAWSVPFSQTAQIQWYGEVASDNGIPPKTQMGNGEFSSNDAAASMATLCYVDVKAWVCYYNNSQSSGATRVNYYDIQNSTYGAVRYGGPGQ